jgi:aminomethyltransferase
MKTTPFTKYHIKAGARMAEFASYNMPIEFTGINNEHIAVRERAGLFDVSHMGEIWIEGVQAFDLLQYITSNNIGALYDGRVQYSCLPNGRGGIVDDILVYRFDEQKYLLVVNAANIEKDWLHILHHGERFGMGEGNGLRNASAKTAQLAMQGPLAMKIVQKLCKEPVEAMKYYTFCVTEVAGISDVVLSITGYTGAGGCELYVDNIYAEKLFEAVCEIGAGFGMQQIGLGARDTLRLEKGYCLYGNDIDDTTSPIEAGLGWITKFVASKEFIDRDILERQIIEGPQRRLAGFELMERGIPRHGYQLASPSGEIIGEATSGTMSPILKKGIGMGYVKTEYAEPGTEIAVIIREKPLSAKIVKTPFV